jgi:hypothetical protein
MKKMMMMMIAQSGSETDKLNLNFHHSSRAMDAASKTESVDPTTRVCPPVLLPVRAFQAARSYQVSISTP